MHQTKKRLPKNVIAWTQEEIDFLKNNYQNGSRFCSKILKRKLGSIRGKLATLKLSSFKEKYSNEEKQWLINNYQNKSRQECAKYLNCSIPALQGLVKKLNIKKYNHDYGDENINKFLINDPDFIYLLGFIWADGYLQIMSNNSKECGIEIQQDDEKYLSKIINQFNIFVTKYRCRKNKKPTVLFKTRNKTFCNILENYNYKNKSIVSPNELLIDIPENLHHYWYRGFLDGDGMIGSSTNNKKYKIFNMSFFGSLKQDWSFMFKLENILNIKFKYRQRIRTTGSGSEIYVEKQDCLYKLGNFIYKDYNNNYIGFERKYKKYLDFLDYRLKYL